MSEQTLYCPSCGEDVPVYEFQAAQGVELRCSYCSFPLGWSTPPDQQAGGTLLIADDSRIIVNLVSDFFKSKQTFDRVLTSENGGTTLKTLAEAWTAKLSISLIIMDIKMPILNGAQVAVALRWLEKGFGLSPIPIIFLSGIRIDENLKKVMEYCAPSFYLNKEAGARPDELLERMHKVATRLMQESE